VSTHRGVAVFVRALALCAAVLAFGPIAGAAQPAGAPRVGMEYELIPQQPVPPGPRVEVIEFFWYGCPHCYQLQGPLEAWLKQKPEDVDFKRIPAIFRDSWAAHARVFYALESLGELGRLHQAVFRALHVDRENPGNAETSAEWAARNGIDRTRWLAAYNSPEVDRKVEQARVATRTYAIQGTPSLVVDGRYVTSSGMSETYQGVVTIMDDLVRIAREQRRTAK
jgi:thiol:disulfide interchange protein DsbA